MALRLDPDRPDDTHDVQPNREATIATRDGDVGREPTDPFDDSAATEPLASAFGTRPVPVAVRGLGDGAAVRGPCRETTHPTPACIDAEGGTTDDARR